MSYLLTILERLAPPAAAVERLADVSIDDPAGIGAVHYIDGDRGNMRLAAMTLDLEVGHLAKLLTNAVLAYERAALHDRCPAPLYADGGRLAVTYVPGHPDFCARTKGAREPSLHDATRPVWRIEVVAAFAMWPELAGEVCGEDGDRRDREVA